MDWLKSSLLIIALIGGLLTECHGRTYLDVVQRYEQCVLNRLYSENFFKEEDKVQVVKVVSEANQRMQLLYPDLTNASDVRTMLRLFTAVLTNMVADNNVPVTPQRKEVYLCVMRTCSLALSPQIGEEIMREVNQIFDSLENAKSVKSGGNGMPVLSRRRGMLSESSITDDHVRSKRSPQAVSFGSSEGWQPTESLQTVLSNILLNSNVFLSVFNAGLSRRNALYYARNMIEAGLGFYHYSVIQEAVNAASNAISEFSFTPSAYDYAFTITSSIASVLEARQLSYFADGVGIGNGLISQLQWMLNNKNPSGSFSTSSSGASSSFSWATSSGSLSNPQRQASVSQANPGYSETKPAGLSMQVDSNQFQNDLAFFLYLSNKIQNAFCNGPFQGIYEMVNGALSEYGSTISTTAAAIITDNLTSMTSNTACAQFGNVIAETVTNILSGNNLLQSANAQLIAEKMASNINLRQDFNSPAMPNQKDSSSQGFSSSFSSSRQEPSIMEYLFPETEPSAFTDIPFESEYPDSGIFPMNPMEQTDFKDSSGTQGFPFESSDSAQIPVQQTKISQEYPQSNPTFELSAPRDYIGDTATSTDISNGQKANSDSKYDSESGDQQSESPKIPSPTNAPIPVDSEIPVEDGPGNPPDTSEKSQAKPNTESENDRTTETAINPKDSENISISTTTENMVPTTPYPNTSTSMDKDKIVEAVLGDIYASLRSLNSSSDGDKQPENSESTTIENTDSTPLMESTMVSTVPTTDKMTTDEAKLTTEITNFKDELQTTQKPSDVLEPSFWPTSAPNSNGESTTDQFRNGTQSSDYESEDEPDLRDPTLAFAEHISSIASSSIAMIRAGNANLEDLCNKANDFAAVVDIPPLDVCNEMALVDFLLNVLKAVTFILRSV